MSQRDVLICANTIQAISVLELCICLLGLLRVQQAVCELLTEY